MYRYYFIKDAYIRELSFILKERVGVTKRLVQILNRTRQMPKAATGDRPKAGFVYPRACLDLPPYGPLYFHVSRGWLQGQPVVASWALTLPASRGDQNRVPLSLKACDLWLCRQHWVIRTEFPWVWRHVISGYAGNTGWSEQSSPESEGMWSLVMQAPVGHCPSCRCW
jgi:hypothetical protein